MVETALDDEIPDLLGEPRPARKQAVSVSKPRYTSPARSVKRTPELEQSILERVAAGESLRKVWPRGCPTRRRSDTGR